MTMWGMFAAGFIVGLVAAISLIIVAAVLFSNQPKIDNYGGTD